MIASLSRLAIRRFSSEAAKKYTLPELSYNYSDLEPVISERLLEIHHKKHHNTYVTNLNNALEQFEGISQANYHRGQVELRLQQNGVPLSNHQIQSWRTYQPLHLLEKFSPHRTGRRRVPRKRLSFHSTGCQAVRKL